MKTSLLTILLIGFALIPGRADESEKLPVAEKLLLDLDAAAGVTLEDGDRVARWTNQAPGAKAKEFVKRDEGRKVKGSGRPYLKKATAALNGKPSLVFRQGELLNMEEDVFDGLTTGKGFTWFCVMCVYEQRVGLKDVNSFFGNLRNGKKCEGLWGNVRDDNTLWTGGRNGITFGRFDKNNPLILGPKLEARRYYLIASRMAAGTGVREIQLFVDDPKAVATGKFPVNPDANPSRLAIGQERDAINHPGKESFDGEIARLLIYEGALGDRELGQMFESLKRTYGIK